MSDIHKIILELTSSQRHEESDLQTVAQLVSENDSIRRDLGGSFGVEAVNNCKTAENFIALIHILATGLRAEIISNKCAETPNIEPCEKLAYILCRAVTQLVLIENESKADSRTDFLSWQSLYILEDVASLLRNIFSVSEQSPDFYPVETVISCFIKVAGEEDDEESVGSCAIALSLGAVLLSILKSPIAVATRKRNIIGLMARRLFSGNHASQSNGTPRSTATAVEVQLCLPVLGITSQNLFDNTLARPLQFKLLSDLASTLETALALIMTLTQALSWQDASLPLDLITHYELPTNIVPAAARALTNTGSDEIPYLGSNLLVALFQYSTTLKSGNAISSSAQVICKHVCNLLTTAVRDIEQGSPTLPEITIATIFDTLYQIGCMYTSIADESILIDIRPELEKKLAAANIRAVEAVTSCIHFALGEETVELAEKVLDEWEIVYKRAGDIDLEEEEDSKEAEANMAIAGQPGVSAVTSQTESKAHAKIMAAMGENRPLAAGSHNNNEHIGDPEKNNSIAATSSSNREKQVAPGAVSCTDQNTIESMKARAFAPLLTKKTEASSDRIIDDSSQMSALLDDKTNELMDNYKKSSSGDYDPTCCDIENTDSSQKMKTKKVPYDNDNPAQLAVAVPVNEEEEVIAYADDFDPWARVPLWKRRKFQVGLCVFFLVIVAVTVAVSVTAVNKVKNDGKKNEALLNPIFQTISGDAVYDSTTPQYYAAQMLAKANDYPLTADSPNLIQRYVITLLYTSLGGVNWRYCSGNGSVGTCEYPCWADGCIKDRCQLTNDSTLFYDGVCRAKNFLDPSHECDWFGVNCTKNMNGELVVQSLYLVQNNLDGTIPSEIMELKSLQVIEAQDNNIKGTIPTTIGALKNLKILYLNNNNLEGTVPTELFSLKGSLTDVNFGSNRLDGRLSKGWGNLTNLQGILLYNNSFSGTLPDEIYGLNNLVTINVRENMLSGTLSSSVKYLESLRSLHLESNKFSGPLSPDIGNLKYLEELVLSDNEFNGTIPSELFNLVPLQYFYVENNNLTGTIPTEIGNLLQLKRLILSGNSFRGTVPSEVATLMNLDYLWLNGNDISGSIPQEICTKREQLSKPSSLYADCLDSDASVKCDCCTDCCYHNMPNAQCYRQDR